jgi:hypothetical protein
MALFGLLRRKTAWRLTGRGWLVMLLILAAGAAAFITLIHPFLAVSRPAGGEILVVEGWLPDTEIAAAVERFRKGGYRLVVTTGGPLERGSYLLAYNSLAELTRSTLVRMGIAEGAVVAVPAPAVATDRTYACAVAFARWLQTSGLEPEAIDIFTRGTHARRTRLLFDHALGERVRVGVISVPDGAYDPDRWWLSSAGVTAVLKECIAYVYTRLLMIPGQELSE